MQTNNMVNISGEVYQALRQLAKQEFLAVETKKAKGSANGMGNQTTNTFESCLSGVVSEYAAAQYLRAHAKSNMSITTCAIAKRWMDYAEGKEAKANKKARIELGLRKGWEEGDIEVYMEDTNTASYWEVKSYAPSYYGEPCGPQLAHSYVSKYDNDGRRGVIFVKMIHVGMSNAVVSIDGMYQMSVINEWDAYLSAYNTDAATKFITSFTNKHGREPMDIEKKTWYRCEKEAAHAAKSKGKRYTSSCDRGHWASHTHPDYISSFAPASDWMGVYDNGSVFN